MLKGVGDREKCHAWVTESGFDAVLSQLCRVLAGPMLKGAGNTQTEADLGADLQGGEHRQPHIPCQPTLQGESCPVEGCTASATASCMSSKSACWPALLHSERPSE